MYHHDNCIYSTRLPTDRHEAPGQSAEGTRDAALLRFLARFGLRISELTRLRVVDVDPARGTVTDKGGRRRTVPVDAETMSMIGEMTDGREGREPLFTDRKGGPISPDAVARILRRCASRAGVTGCSDRVLRHSLTAILVAAGSNLAAGYSLPSNVVRNVTAEEVMAAIKGISE